MELVKATGTAQRNKANDCSETAKFWVFISTIIYTNEFSFNFWSMVISFLFDLYKKKSALERTDLIGYLRFGLNSDW